VRACALIVILGISCGSAPLPEEEGPAAIALEARVQFPLMLSVHEGVIEPSCSACHDSAAEYPPLETPRALLDTISAPCRTCAHGGALVVANRPGDSYLLERLKGGEAELGDVALLAITCWIETLGRHPSIFDPIDYDRCSVAADLPAR